MIEFRPGQRLIIPGVRVVQPVPSGAFTPASAGTLSLWLDADAPATLFQNSNGTTAAIANNDPVGYWGDKSGGNRHVIQATAGNRPLLQTALPSVLFDGTNDRLAYAGALSDTDGSVVVVFRTGVTAFATRGAQAIISSADEGTANNWFEVGIGADGRIYIESNAGGTKHTVVGSTYLEVSTDYLLAVIFDNTDYYASINGVEQNPLTITNVGVFAWFGDVANADNIVVGGTVTSAGLVRPFQGQIMELATYSEDITL